MLVAKKTVNNTTLTLHLVDDPGLYTVVLSYPRESDDSVGEIEDDEVVAFVHDNTVPKATGVDVANLRWEVSEGHGKIRAAMSFFADDAFECREGGTFIPRLRRE